MISKIKHKLYIIEQKMKLVLNRQEIKPISEFQTQSHLSPDSHLRSVCLDVENITPLKQAKVEKELNIDCSKFAFDIVSPLSNAQGNTQNISLGIIPFTPIENKNIEWKHADLGSPMDYEQLLQQTPSTVIIPKQKNINSGSHTARPSIDHTQSKIIILILSYFNL